MKLISILLIMAGVIGASVCAAHIPPLWIWFTLFLVIAAIGIYLNRKPDGGMDNIRAGKGGALKKFKRLIDEQGAWIESILQNENITIATFTDGNIEGLYAKVEEIRVDLLNQLGMKKYIALISPFARAERMLYRGYSATIDGYEDEARDSMGESLTLFKATRDEMENF